MKETFYFTHDYNASQDPKILNMLSEQKWEGYGLYWMLIEKLAEAKGKLLFSDLKGIAFSTHTDEKTLKKIICDFSLFENNADHFWSNRLLDHLCKRQKISKIRAKLGQKGGLAKAKQLPSNSSSKTKQRKVKESKGKEIENTLNFSIFWEAYQNKKDRPKCEAKWARLSLAEQTAILEHIPKYLATIKDKKYQKHPATFLNNRSWENEIDEKEIDTTGWSDMKIIEQFGVAGLKKYRGDDFKL